MFDSVSPVVPAGCFKSEFVPNPSKFPFATLMEIDNLTSRRNRSSSLTEDYAIVTYEANVYDTSKHGCRTVMNTLDDAMVRLGFMRITSQFVPNLADPNLYRYTARYQAIADPNKVIYRP